jgi:hypothetical protein
LNQLQITHVGGRLDVCRLEESVVAVVHTHNLANQNGARKQVELA